MTTHVRRYRLSKRHGFDLLRYPTDVEELRAVLAAQGFELDHPRRKIKRFEDADTGDMIFEQER